jgi:phosphate transport system substrate-binding protein
MKPDSPDKRLIKRLVKRHPGRNQGWVYRFFKAAAFVAAAVLLITSSEALTGKTASLLASSKDSLRGKAFSDPSKVFPMDENWVKQPIRYESWAEGAEIAVVLDQQLYPAILPLIEEFGRVYGIKIATHEGTCGTAAGAALRKSADITGMCCATGETDRLPGLRYHTVGIASEAFLVRKDNPIDNISLDDARKIFMGKLTNWNQIKNSGSVSSNAQSSPSRPPLPNMQIKPIVRLHCKTRPGHWCLLLANADLFGTKVIEVNSIQDMIEQVAAIRGSIGSETLWMVKTYKFESRLKPLKLDGIDPADNGSLSSGKYPIYRTFNITTWEGPGIENKQAQKLVEYILSNLHKVDPGFGIVPAGKLKKSGWKFNGSEVVGEPD